MSEAGGSLVSLEFSRSRNLLQQSQGIEFTFTSPVRPNSNDDTKQYIGYRKSEAGRVHDIDVPLGRSIRNLKRVKLTCKDMGLWDHGKCDGSTRCRVLHAIQGL